MTDTQQLFNQIAQNYDRANTILSLGLHHRWNRALVDQIRGDHLLDLCAGTGEIGFRYLRQNPHAKATLLDFSSEMIEIAKIKGEKHRDRCDYIIGDAQQIPLPDGTVDGVTIAYGIRNVQNIDRCFEETYRVLKPEGLFGILELTRPSHPLLRLGHRFYLRTFVPMTGKWTAHDKAAYHYLARTIDGFISPQEMEEKLRKAGFQKIESRPLTGGVATLIFGIKKG